METPKFEIKTQYTNREDGNASTRYTKRADEDLDRLYEADDSNNVCNKLRLSENSEDGRTDFANLKAKFLTENAKSVQA